jgi:hypothetical protein
MKNKKNGSKPGRRPYYLWTRNEKLAMIVFGGSVPVPDTDMSLGGH